MREIKGFFFDLDDTLVGTKDANFHAYRDAFADVGFELTYEDFLKHWGKDSRQFIPELLPSLHIKQVDEIRKRKSAYYSKYLHKTTLNYGLVAFLTSMTEHYTTVLVTTAKSANASEILNLHNLQSLFTYTIFGDEVEKGKPHPEPYLKALRISNLKPEETIAFEDSKNGMDAAKAAGITVIRVRSFA